MRWSLIVLSVLCLVFQSPQEPAELQALGDDRAILAIPAFIDLAAPALPFAMITAAIDHDTLQAFYSLRVATEKREWAGENNHFLSFPISPKTSPIFFASPPRPTRPPEGAGLERDWEELSLLRGVRGVL